MILQMSIKEPSSSRTLSSLFLILSLNDFFDSSLRELGISFHNLAPILEKAGFFFVLQVSEVEENECLNLPHLVCWVLLQDLQASLQEAWALLHQSYFHFSSNESQRREDSGVDVLREVPRHCIHRDNTAKTKATIVSLKSSHDI